MPKYVTLEWDEYQRLLERAKEIPTERPPDTFEIHRSYGALVFPPCDDGVVVSGLNKTQAEAIMEKIIGDKHPQYALYKMRSYINFPM